MQTKRKRPSRLAAAVITAVTISASLSGIGAGAANAATITPKPTQEAQSIAQASTNPDSEVMAAIAAELEANALLISETSNRNEKRSTYEYKGATLTVVSELAAPDPTSPGVAPRFGIDTRFLPRLIIVDLSRADQQALASGGLGALNVALCAIPGIGWVSCGFITGAIQSAGEYIKNNGLCQNTFYITFDLQSNPKPWVSYRCS